MYCQTCSVNSGCAWYSAMHAGVGRERAHDPVIGCLRDAAPDRAGAESRRPNGRRRAVARRATRGRAPGSRLRPARTTGRRGGSPDDRSEYVGWKRFAAWPQSMRRGVRVHSPAVELHDGTGVSSRPHAARRWRAYDGRAGAGAAWRARGAASRTFTAAAPPRRRRGGFARRRRMQDHRQLDRNRRRRLARLDLGAAAADQPLIGRDQRHVGIDPDPADRW